MAAKVAEITDAYHFSVRDRTPRRSRDTPSFVPPRPGPVPASLDADPAAVDGVGLGVVPTRRRGIEMRERLLAAALDEFDDHGVAASRVERIVERVGTSWGTFFRYFPRKEDVLLVAGARHFRERVRPVIDAGLADPGRPRREVARDAFGALLEPERSPRLHAEMLREVARFPIRFAAILEDGEMPLIAVLTGLMADGQQRGEVRGDVPAPVCATVLAAGVIFSTLPALAALADGHVPEAHVQAVSGHAFEAAWSGVGA